MKKSNKRSSDSSLALGSAIKEARVRLSLSQQQLSEFAGCGITFINQLERGKETIRLDKLLQVLEVLGLTLTLARGKTALVVKM